MNNEKLIPISVTIGDRVYRVKVDVSEEEGLRKTVKIINEKILSFKTTLAGKDMQDYIAMVMLWYATQPSDEVNNILQQQEVTTELNRLNAMLDKAVE
jgi:cell division protein ZapA (FtsZ GTPase activity inhibitor)